MSAYYRNFDGHQPKGRTEGIIAIFSLEPVQNNFKSEEAGRPIFEDREFVRKVVVGDNKMEVFREATDADREEFSEEYARFKAGLKDQEQCVGTPLKEWPPMTPALVRNFGAVNVHTVEQLAAMSEISVQNFGMGGREWREKAQSFLARANGVEAETDALKARIAELEAKIAALGDERRGPGRPRKDVA